MNDPFESALHNEAVHRHYDMLSTCSDSHLRGLADIAQKIMSDLEDKDAPELMDIVGFGMTYIDLEIARREKAKRAN
jgi:hypothetical protein